MEVSSCVELPEAVSVDAIVSDWLVSVCVRCVVYELLAWPVESPVIVLAEPVCWLPPLVLMVTEIVNVWLVSTSSVWLPELLLALLVWAPVIEFPAVDEVALCEPVCVMLD